MEQRASSTDLRTGPWTEEEDGILRRYIDNNHGGVAVNWLSIAQNSGLRRSGSSCRHRWINHLSPDIRRGNITVEEKLLILELRLQYGNSWSRIAQHLPGRTDHEIKNFFNSQLKTEAKKRCHDVYSREFMEEMRRIYQDPAGAGGSGGGAAPSDNV